MAAFVTTRFACLLLFLVLLTAGLSATAAVPTKRPIFLFSSKTKRMLHRPHHKPAQAGIRWIFQQK
ncbi:hypothetical protein LJY25_01495 [Hymenobacter sp. BT175]|uniref:hypothetical protein n=1 Tax=Hymenobacter translucens TaxID=2886507 RepID=UPI001D0EAC57|nr:hypothetical protein [Hymenobacter translucens]MCC2545105.1 hypothetical protein [Hymenobacter translucens]